MSGRRRVTDGAESTPLRRVRRRRRPVKFIWGAGKALPGRWVLGLFGYYTQDTGVKTEGVAVSVRGLLGWGAVALLAVYLAGATALHLVWSRNPYSRLTYADALLLPLRKDAVTRKKGQAFLAEGMAALEQKKWQAGISLLQFGLARYPEDRSARMALARIYHATEQRAQALQLMADGLTGAYPGKDYLATYFGWLELAENHAAIVTLTERFRREGAGAGGDAEWLAEQRYLALAAAGRHGEALAAAEAEGEGRVAMERQVTALLALQRPADALLRLAGWRARAGADLWLVTKLQAQALRDLGRWDEMEVAMEELRQLLPGEPGAPVFRILQRVRAGRPQAAREALADYFFRFGGSPDNLRLAAKPLAELGAADGVRDCIAAARERGYPLAPLQVLLIQALLVNGEWSEANRILGELPEPGKEELDAARAWRGWVGALVQAAQSPAEPLQRALADQMRTRAWRPQVLRETVTAMLLADRLETAREVLEHARRTFPHIGWFETEAQSVALRIMARTPAVGGPAPAGDGETLTAAGFTAALERHLRGERWAEAARLIHRAYGLRPTPEWLEGAEAGVRLAQVRIARAERDQPGLLTACRLFLNGEADRGRRLLVVANEFLALGDPAAAVALTREIIRRAPGATEAEQTLAAWAVRVPEAREAMDAINAAGANRDEGSLMAEIRRRQEAGDMPGLLAVVRTFLNGDPRRAQQVSRWEAELQRRGELVAAEALNREVARKAGADATPGTRTENAGAGKSGGK